MTLNSQIIEKHGLNIGECLYLLGKIHKVDFSNKDIEHSLIQKGCISQRYGQDLAHAGYFITGFGKDLLTDVLLESEKIVENAEDLCELAKQLKEIFPKGMKENAHRSWTEGVQLIVKRLQIFFKKYGRYSNEEILKAAQAYVDSYNGNYQYMQVLRYFIFKDKKGADGNVENESQLVNFIENADQLDELRNDWTSQLV